MVCYTKAHLRFLADETSNQNAYPIITWKYASPSAKVGPLQRIYQIGMAFFFPYIYLSQCSRERCLSQMIVCHTAYSTTSRTFRPLAYLWVCSLFTYILPIYNLIDRVDVHEDY